MPTWESTAQRGARRATFLLRRLGEELRRARFGAGLSTRQVASMLEISHTQVRRIESGLAPHIDIGLMSRMAAVVGHELSLGLHPVAAPVRDKAHLALLRRFAARLHLWILWRTEVPMPIPGDRRSADGVAFASDFDAIVEAETRLDDVQAAERRLRGKQRDLDCHNRMVIDQVPELRRQFPVDPRHCLAALGRGVDPGGDCLLIL